MGEAKGHLPLWMAVDIKMEVIAAILMVMVMVMVIVIVIVIVMVIVMVMDKSLYHCAD